METAPLFLSDHVYACTANNYLVFLDVNQDRYSCLDRASTRAILGRIAGLSFSGNLPTPPTDRQSVPAHEVIDALLEKSLLTTDASGALSVARDRAPEVQRELTAAPNRTVPRMVTNLARAAWSARIVERQLRLQPLKDILQQIRRRRERLAYRNSRATVRSVSDVAAAFLSVRHLIPRERVCLFDSLAMLDFMFRHGVAPRLVFGVKMDPFAAHCWLQFDDLVLNDSVENVAVYSHIMTV